MVGLARPIVSAGPAAAPPVDAEMTAVRHFYGAVNAAIVDGDATRLDGVVAEDFADHAPQSEDLGNRADLERIVRDLAATEPSLRLTPLDLIAQNDRVVARLQVDGAADQTLFGIAVEGARPWSAVEILRVAQGKIAERWAASETTPPPRELFESTIDVRPPARKSVALDRVTIAAGADAFHSLVVSPGALFVEHGLLVATIDPESSSAAASVVRASTTGQPPMTEAITPGRRLIIGPGDLLVFEEGTRYDLANENSSAASALLLTSFVPADPGGVPMLTTPVPSGVSFSQVAGGVASLLPVGADDVALGRVTLEPATAIAPHTAAGPEFVVVESGTLRLSSEGDEPLFRSGEDGAGRFLAGGPLVAGDSVLVPAGTTFDFRNVGQIPAVALVVRITPGLASPIASPTS
jgi:predicted ester cyclase